MQIDIKLVDGKSIICLPYTIDVKFYEDMVEFIYYLDSTYKEKNIIATYRIPRKEIKEYTAYYI